jgi:hypothetical protein
MTSMIIRSTNLWRWANVFLLLILVCSLAKSTSAQTPLPQLRLLAWSSDDTFLLGATPAQVVTLPDNSRQQLQTLWLLPANGLPPQQLAEGFDLQLSPDHRFVTFTRLDSQNQPSQWGIEVATGVLKPLDPGQLSAAAITTTANPPGQTFFSPDGKKRAILVNQLANAALWVGEENAPAQLILQGQGEIFSEVAWRPDSQALAFIRTPLGRETDVVGELWRLNLSDRALTPLSQNNVVDRSPVWNADGTSLAVIRNEKLVIVSANQLMAEEFNTGQPAPAVSPALPIGAAAQLTPPATIRVIHCVENTCRSVPVGQIDTIPFEEYVKRVVPHEVPSYWPAETLKAQAVAARTYGWSKYLQNPAGDYHVTDWINHQYMCDTTFPPTNQAVDDTASEYLAYNGNPIIAMFSAENASPTKNNIYGYAYLRAVDDPVSFGQTRNGHGQGLGQWGAQRWASQHNWSYQAILRHYYTNVTLEKGLGDNTAPPNVSIVTPWANHYLTSHKLRILVNTSDDGGSIAQTNIYLSTPTETTLLASEAGPASPTGYVLDVSGWTDQALISSTLVLTAEAFDTLGQRGVSPEVVIGLDRIAPTAMFTTTTAPISTTIISVSAASSTLIATDDTAGVTHIAMGRREWAWEGEDLSREQVAGQPVGQIVSDPDALNGTAMQATTGNDPAGAWFSPEMTLPAPQQYRGYARIKVNDNAVSGEVARLEIINNDTGELIGLHRIRGTDFRASDVYQEFHIDMDYPTQASNQQGVPFTFQLIFLDIADVWLDRIIALEYPIPFTPYPTYAPPFFRLKAIDGAGNVSDDLLVTPNLAHSVYLPLVVK